MKVNYKIISFSLILSLILVTFFIYQNKNTTKYEDLEKNEIVQLNQKTISSSISPLTSQEINALKNVQLQLQKEHEKKTVLFSFNCFGIVNTNTTFVCSGNGNCTATDTCSCNPGFNGNQCQNQCPSLTLSSVEVPNTGDRVVISFNQFIATSTITACNNGLANIISNTTLSRFGTGATCSSNNPTQLTITLGSSNVNITRFDLISFVNNTLLAVGGCGNFFNNPVQITRIPTPVPILTGPNQISSCSQTFVIDAGASNTGRFNYRWSMNNNGNGDYNSTLDSFLTGLPTNTSRVTLSTDSFRTDVLSTIRLTLENLFDFSTVTTTLNIYKNSFESPIVVLNCNPSVLITQQNQFSAAVNPSCGRTGVTYSYNWISDIGVTTSNILTVPANTYRLGRNHNVTLTTTQLLNGVSIGNATTTCNFVGIAGNPIARTTSEGNTISIRDNQQLTVDGSVSNDAAGNTLFFNWTCCTLTNAGCNAADCATRFPTLKSTFSNRFILAPTLPTGVFRFFITATTSDSRTSTSIGETYNIISSSQAVVLSSSVSVQSSTLSVCVVRTPAATSDTFSWSIFTGDITLPNVLNTPCIYPLLTNIRSDSILTATVTQGGIAYTLLVNVFAPFTPTGGSFVVLNTDLSVATSPLSQSSNYILNAPSWVGRTSSSLRYTFRITDPNGVSVFTSTTSTPSVSITSVSLPKPTTQSNYVFSVSVIDTTSSPSGNLAATRSSTIAISAFSLNGQSAENAAQSLLNSVQTCSSTDTNCIINGLSSVSTVLNLNSIKGGTVRQNIVTSSINLITNSLSTFASLQRNFISDLLPAISSLGSNSQDLSPAASNSIISILSQSIVGNSVTLEDSQVSTVLNTLSNSFRSLTSTTPTLFSQNTNQQSAISTRTILKKIALGIETNPGTSKDYSTTDYGLTLFRYAGSSSVPTSTISNTFFQFTPPNLNLPATNGPIDFIVTRYQTGYFYGNNYINNSFPTLGFEFVRKDNNNIIPISGLTTPIIFVIAGNGPSSTCRFLDVTSTEWRTDNVGTMDTNNGLRCNTTFLAEFTGFRINNPGTTTPPADNNNLYYLLLLLLIFPICLIFAVIVGFIGFTCFKIFQGRANLGFLKKIGGGGNQSTTPQVTTDKDKDMIDLGI